MITEEKLKKVAEIYNTIIKKKLELSRVTCRDYVDDDKRYVSKAIDLLNEAHDYLWLYASIKTMRREEANKEKKVNDGGKDERV